MDLSKSDKKVCRDLIEKGLQREFTRGLQEAESILCNWKSRNKDVKETYYSLYKMITNFDKQIGRRFDDITGSRYVFSVAMLVNDKIITPEECLPFSEDVRDYILRVAAME